MPNSNFRKHNLSGKHFKQHFTGDLFKLISKWHPTNPTKLAGGYVMLSGCFAASGTGSLADITDIFDHVIKELLSDFLAKCLIKYNNLVWDEDHGSFSKTTTQSIHPKVQMNGWKLASDDSWPQFH